MEIAQPVLDAKLKFSEYFRHLNHEKIYLSKAAFSSKMAKISVILWLGDPQRFKILGQNGQNIGRIEIKNLAFF